MMFRKSYIKHCLHCGLYFTLLFVFESDIFLPNFNCPTNNQIDPFQRYGYIPAILLYLLKSLSILVFPYLVFHYLGIIIFNAFPDDTELKDSPSKAPFISIRVVTRGDYPELVKKTVKHNMDICFEVGQKNFVIEVVTNKAIDLKSHPRIREIVVPSSYRTKSGAMYKARNLQYCLEDDINMSSDSQWIVHLDEETLMTENSLKGIINFVLDGKHQFGQGLITFSSGNVVNWLTTLTDGFLMSYQLGSWKLQFKILHRPLLGMKGSFFVTNAEAEKKVSFDHGPEGSILEDAFFALKAYEKGHTFDFIEGEMWEESPYTVGDYLHQRARWSLGSSLVVRSPAIPLRFKAFFIYSVYLWRIMPIGVIGVIIDILYPIPCCKFIKWIYAFNVASFLYWYILGVIMTFSVTKHGPIKTFLCILCGVCVIPVNIVLGNLAVICAFFAKKDEFYIVKKDM